MKTFTAMVISSTLLLGISTAQAADTPVNSTSTSQAAKEQLNNKNHQIDDCRIKANQNKPECLTPDQMKKKTTTDQKMMEQGKTRDHVEQQDVNKKPGANQQHQMDKKSTKDDQMMKKGETQDQIEHQDVPKSQ